MDTAEELRSGLTTLASRIAALENGTAVAAVAELRRGVAAAHAEVTSIGAGLHTRLDGVERHVTETVRHWHTPAIALVLGFALGAGGLAAVARYWS